MFFYLNIKGTTKVCQIKNPNNKAAAAVGMYT